jgi:hypothetical protein
MSVAYTILFWFVFLTTLASGGLGFLLRLPSFYHPDAYLVVDSSGALSPGTGSTPFEQVATFVFGVVYVAPLVGMLFARFEGSAAAMRAALTTPFVYHAASVIGVLWVFPHGLNPRMASLGAAASMHVVYAVLFAVLWVFARDASQRSRR